MGGLRKGTGKEVARKSGGKESGEKVEEREWVRKCGGKGRGEEGTGWGKLNKMEG